jgi:hypothetical protein
MTAFSSRLTFDQERAAVDDVVLADLFANLQLGDRLMIVQFGRVGPSQVSCLCTEIPADVHRALNANLHEVGARKQRKPVSCCLLC